MSQITCEPFHGGPTNGYVVAADDLNVKRPSLVSRSCRPPGVTVTACRHFGGASRSGLPALVRLGARGLPGERGVHPDARVH